jgi:hypothetical protein
MRKDILPFVLLISLFGFTFQLTGQTFPTLVEPVAPPSNIIGTCGTDRMSHMHSEENPDYAKDLEYFKEVVVPHLASLKNQNPENGNLLVIPTVVHIIHNGEPIGQGQNLEELRILGQMDVLNQDFAALNPEFNNTPPQWTSVLGTPNIQFCLATVDPDGNSTNGINRVQYTITGSNWQNNNIESELKPDINWDPDKYLNIYVVPIPGTTAQGGVVGYSGYPTPFSIGSPTDGPVIDYRWFGAPGFDQSGYRAITHEIGHYLGLPHPFEGTSCNDDDGISDTPNVEEATLTLANLNCANSYPAGPVSCGNEHMYVNYMDYANENCYTSFTAEQVSVMRAVLDGTSMGFGYGSRKPLVDNSAFACILNEHDAGILAVLEPSGRVCSNDTIFPSVRLRNFGTETLESVYIAYEINGTNPDTLFWEGNLNSGSNEDVSLNGFTPPDGQYEFKVYTFLPNSMDDQRMSNDSSALNLDAAIPKPLPVFEDLEGEMSFPTNDGYFRLNVNPQFDNFQWIIAGGLSAYGVGDQCLWFNNFDGTQDENPFLTTDAIISPHFDLSNSTGNLLTFDVAYAPFDEQFSDTLLILAAVNCSNSYDTLLYVKGGEELSSAPPSADFFIPSSTEWRTDTVDLSGFDGIEDLSLAFVNFSGWGNNLFLDNINVGAPCNLAFSMESENTSCNSECDGMASVTADLGDDLTYQWSNGQSGNTISNLCPGTYQVTISDGNGCDAIGEITIEEPDELTVGISATSETANDANDGTAIANPNGGNQGYSYMWSNGSTDQIATNLAPGTYTVTITDSKDCEVTASVTVPEYDCSGFSASVSTTTVSCFGDDDGSALVNPTGSFGPYNYNWSNGSTEQQAFGLTAGNYTVTITDGFNCPFTVSGTVNQPNELTADATATSETGNGANDGTASVTFDGGTDPITALWSNGQAGTTITNLAPGNYTVTVTDANDCTAAQSVTVNSFDCGGFMADIISTNVSCFGENDGSAQVIGVVGNNPFFYNWSNGLNDQSITNLSAGMYEVTVSDASDCQTVLFVNITEPQELTATLNKTDETSSGGNNGTASVNPSGGNQPFTYSWSNGANSSSVSNLEPGNYSVTVTDNNDCTWSQTFTIEPFDCAISGNLSITNATCPNSADGSASINVMGGTGPFDISWSSGDSGPTAENLPPGFYIVTVVDANECDFMQTFQVMGFDNDDPILITQTIDVELDADGQATLTPQMVDNGSFDNCGIASMSISQTDFDCGHVGNQPVVFTVVDVNGNEASATVTVNIVDNQPPVVTSCPANIELFDCEEIVTYDLPKATDNCDDLTMELVSGFGTGGLFPVGVTTETYVFTDAGGNETECSFTVTLDYDLSLGFDIQEPSCNGFSDGSLFINATGGVPPYQFEFSGGGDPVNLSAGMYSTTLEDGQGCIVIEMVEITEPPALTLDIGNVTPATNGQGGSIEIFVGGGTGNKTINYYLDGVLVENPNPMDLAPGDYIVEIVDENGCSLESNIITVDNMVGVDEATLENLISIYPNPTNGQVFIKLDLPQSAWVDVQVLDVNGQEITPISSDKMSQNTFQLNLDNLSAGVYLVKVMVDDEMVTKRLVLFN